MNFDKLENNITDMIKEQQIKIGYMKEAIRLNYPLSSLNNLLGTEFDLRQMLKALGEYSQSRKDRYGEMQAVSRPNDGVVCLIFDPKASEYIHNELPRDEFLEEFIAQIAKHQTSIDQVFEIFHKYSKDVIIENIDNGEFDYLVYFKDGKPDEFRYCLKDEGHHITYHRFTKTDYEDFGF